MVNNSATARLPGIVGQEGSRIIKMDFREGETGIEKILSQKYSIQVSKQTLPVGDYIIEEQIAVERKTTLDFAQSIVDGRLFKQAARLKRFFDSSLLIVEGNNLYDPGLDIHSHCIRGALVSVSLSWQIPILFSKDIEDTAFFIWLISGQEVKAKQELFCRPGRRPKRPRKQQLYILQGLPQIGPKLAGELLDSFGSVEKVITASSEELQKVRGLGKAKVEKVRNAVREERARYG